MKITEEMLYESVSKAEELWLSLLPTEDELPEHVFSKKFEKQMKKLIQAQRRTPWRNGFISASKRVAVVALVILTVSFSCLMCVEAYRERFIEVITEIFEDLTRFTFSTPDTDVPELGELMFDYLPDGMSEIYRENDPETHYQFVYFEDMEGRRISIERNIIIDNKWSTLILDTENAEVATVDLNGYEATLIVKGDHTTLMWEDAVSVMLVSGDFSPEEIFKVANGIHFTKK